MKSELEILTDIYDLAMLGAPHGLDNDTQKLLKVFVDNCETNKGVLSVFVTLMLKKIISPNQDIRNHQANMPGGFSARGFDGKHITPFLRLHNFPHMVSGAGALTRSLEQAVPYNLDYTGKIKPENVRIAFLSCIERVQNGRCDAREVLQYLFCGLIEHRNKDQGMKLIKPKNRSIAVTMNKIDMHFAQAGKGGSRLPVLSIFAVYKQMVSEMAKYKGCRLCDLQAHQAADTRSGFLGDIQVNDHYDNPMEAVEIKHDIKLTPALVKSCYDKFKTTRVHTYYLLSTDERIDEFAKISEMTMDIHQKHGCQMIVNGIHGTLRYYLRLISSPDNFLSDYVELVEQECSYEIKSLWQKLWEDDS